MPVSRMAFAAATLLGCVVVGITGAPL
jgi:hypothetical protein